MDENSITTEDCETILRNFSKSAKYVSHSIRSLAEDVEGYLSSHFSLKINYIDENNEETSETFFMKTQPRNTGFLSEFAQNLDVFRKEAFVYKLCEELEEMRHFTPFAPKCYLHKEDALVIENLTKQNYQITETNVLYDLEACKMGLKTLALYHATCIAYEEHKTKEEGRIFRLNLEYPKEFEDKYYTMDPESSTYKFLAASEKLVLDLIDKLSKIPNKEEFKNMVQTESEEVPEKMDFMKPYRQCVLHCDLWSKNIMFKKTDGVITDCRLIDFQLLRYFLPGFDVLLLLHANTSLAFRKAHKNQLFKYYYSCLDSQLALHGLSCSKIIPYQDLLDGIIISEPSAKMAAFNDTALMNLPQSLLVEANKNPDLFREVLIEKRSEYIFDVVNSNSEFENWVSDELLELKEALEFKQYFISNNTCL